MVALDVAGEDVIHSLFPHESHELLIARAHDVRAASRIEGRVVEEYHFHRLFAGREVGSQPCQLLRGHISQAAIGQGKMHRSIIEGVMHTRDTTIVQEVVQCALVVVVVARYRIEGQGEIGHKCGELLKGSLRAAGHQVAGVNQEEVAILRYLLQEAAVHGTIIDALAAYGEQKGEGRRRGRAWLGHDTDGQTQGHAQHHEQAESPEKGLAGAPANSLHQNVLRK